MASLTELAMEGLVTPAARAPLFVGIDCGIEGYIAELEGEMLSARAVPRIGDHYDLPEMYALAASWRKRAMLVALEQQQAYPDSAGLTNFGIGYGYGLWKMALTAAGVRFEEILPRQWKAALRIVPPSAPRGSVRSGAERDAKKEAVNIRKALKKSGRKPTPEEHAILEAARAASQRRAGQRKEAKGLAVALAQQLFPGFDFREHDRCRVPHDGKAEASLLAVVAQRLHFGRL